MKSSRRTFLKGSAAAVSAASILATPFQAFSGKENPSNSKPLVVVTKGDSPASNVRKAIEALGGIGKFVKKGDRVLLKPNSISEAGPRFAVNTNPEVTREVVRLCMKAGASEVMAGMNDRASSSNANGTTEALESEGARLYCTNNRDDYNSINLHRGIIYRETQIMRELMDFEVFINLPIAKHHAGVQLTLGIKNFLGLILNAPYMHRIGIDQAIADLATVRKADLTVVDATRMLLTNGPSGPGTVREEKTIVASADPLAADAYITTLFKLEPRSIRHLQCSYELGLGEIDLKRMDIRVLEG